MADVTDTNSILIHGFKVCDEGTKENYNLDDPTATRTILCKWEDRASLAGKMFGGFNPATGLYEVPDHYPDGPLLFVREIATDGVDGKGGRFIGSNGMVAYKYARLTITYGKLIYDPTKITQGELQIDYGSETIVPAKNTSVWKWPDNTPCPPGDAPAIRIATATLSWTRYSVGDLPNVLNFNMLGKVNKYAFLGAAPETLRYDGMQSQKTIVFASINNWNICFRFKWRSVSWNSIFNPKASPPGYQAVTAITDGTTLPYVKEDFAPFEDPILT